MASKFKSNDDRVSGDNHGSPLRQRTISEAIMKLAEMDNKLTESRHNLPHPNGYKHNKPKREDLPVDAVKDEFHKLLNESNSVLIVGETGSGKTTQIPQWCLDYCLKDTPFSTNHGRVACTQPRRIAAMSVAERVTEERGQLIGDQVAYNVRFESTVSATTRLIYQTDGMLLREASFDQLLRRYDVIILDEAHERTLQTEILFGVVKRAQTIRNAALADGEKGARPLKVVIMSATINVKLFRKFFDAPLLRVEGRQHPVEKFFTESPQSDILSSAITCVFQIHRQCEEGDILVFCAGQDEIQTLVQLTKKVLRYAASQPQIQDSLLNLIPLPLYASLPFAQQMIVFDRDYQIAMKTNGASSNGKPNAKNSDDEGDDSDNASNGIATKPPISLCKQSKKNFRRVIYATNVAETSVTIPCIKYVIDTGKVKCRTYCPKTGLESLKMTTISKAQAEQRAGRAGRTAPGMCYRLYTKESYTKMSEYLSPEIKRCNLDSVLLQLITIDSECIRNFEFLERPDNDRIKSALRYLLSLKAIIPASSKPKKDSDHLSNGLESSSRTATPSSSSPESDANSTGVAKGLNHITATALADDALLNLGYDLTSLGAKLRMFPLHPSMSRIILAANELGCLDEALTVISLLSIENLYHIPPSKQSQAEAVLSKFYSNEGDVVMLLNVFRAFRRTSVTNRKGLKQWCIDHFIHIKNLKMARQIRKELVAITKGLGMQSSTCSQDTTILRRALTYGLFNNVATLWDGKYRNSSTTREIHIHPSSCLFKTRPECVLYTEVVETNKCYMRNCTLIDMNWIRDATIMTPGSSKSL